MALIDCPKCGKPISDKALNCPHCGASMSVAEPTMPEPLDDDESQQGKRKTIIAVCAVVAVALLCAIGYYFFFMPKTNDAKPEASTADVEAMKDSLYANFTSRSLDIAEVHGFVKSIKHEFKEAESKLGVSDLPLTWAEFNKEGEIVKYYNSDVSVSHQGARSLIVSKMALDDDERSGSSSGRYRYDISEFVFGNNGLASMDITTVLADKTNAECNDEKKVVLSDYKDGKYHRMTITVPMYYGDIKRDIKYTYTKTDDMGNWIERVGEGTAVYSYNKDNVEHFSVVEKRQITYYDKSEIDLDKMIAQGGGVKNETTGNNLFEEIGKIRSLLASQEQQTEMAGEEMGESGNSADTSQLCVGRWYAYDEDSETGWTYTYRQDGTGSLKVSVPNFNTPIDASFK